MDIEQARKVFKEANDGTLKEQLEKEEHMNTYTREEEFNRILREAERTINVHILNEFGGFEEKIRKTLRWDTLEVAKTETYIKHLGVFDAHLDRVDQHLARIETTNDKHLARIETTNDKQLEVFERFTTAIEKLVGMVETTMAKDNSYRSKS